MTDVAPTLDPAFVNAFRAGTSKQAQAEAVLPRDHLAASFVLLQLSAAIAGKPDATALSLGSGCCPPTTRLEAKNP